MESSSNEYGKKQHKSAPLDVLEKNPEGFECLNGRKKEKSKKKKLKSNEEWGSSVQALQNDSSDAGAMKKSKKKQKKPVGELVSSGQGMEDAFVQSGEGDTEGMVMGRKKIGEKRKNAESNGELGTSDQALELDTGPANDKDKARKKKHKEKKTTEMNGQLGSLEREEYGNGIFQTHGGNYGKDATEPSGAPAARSEVKSNGKKSELPALANRNIRDDVDLQVTVSGQGSESGKFKPLRSFQEVDVPQNVLNCCKDFERPSPIQAHAWPFLLDGRDLIGIAATGSGKTLAFGLPALVHVLKRGRHSLMQKHPICLVLSPTRELAQQISDVLVEAGHPCGVRTACLYGGTSKKPQIAALKGGVAVIVATPGRLQDLVEEGRCSLQDVSYLVLDEADRMLDLGFEHAVRALISQTSKSRQMIMFSATWPLAVNELSKEFMSNNPIKVIVGSQDLAANHAVTQIVEVIEHTARDTRLVDLLKKYHKSERNRVLVFVLYKKEAVRVENMLQRKGWNVCAVHGDKGQSDRNKAVTSFKNGTCPLLIATDVAARGLDIPDVEYVINFSFPLTTEDYVHRIGRTGRAGKSGIAHTFFTQADKARAGELVNVLKEAEQTVPPELLKFGTSVKKKESKLYGAHFKEVAEDAPKATKITFDSDDD